MYLFLKTIPCAADNSQAGMGFTISALLAKQKYYSLMWATAASTFCTFCDLGCSSIQQLTNDSLLWNQ